MLSQQYLRIFIICIMDYNRLFKIALTQEELNKIFVMIMTLRV